MFLLLPMNCGDTVQYREDFKQSSVLIHLDKAVLMVTGDFLKVFLMLTSFYVLVILVDAHRHSPPSCDDGVGCSLKTQTSEKHLFLPSKHVFKPFILKVSLLIEWNEWSFYV